MANTNLQQPRIAFLKSSTYLVALLVWEVPIPIIMWRDTRQLLHECHADEATWDPHALTLL